MFRNNGLIYVTDVTSVSVTEVFSELQQIARLHADNIKYAFWCHIDVMMERKWKLARLWVQKGWEYPSVYLANRSVFYSRRQVRGSILKGAAVQLS